MTIAYLGAGDPISRPAGAVARPAGLFGWPPERRADRGNRAGGWSALAGPQGRHGVEIGGERVGGLFVVDPPADEILPCLGGVALDREVDLAHPVDRAEEVLIGQADPAA